MFDLWIESAVATDLSDDRRSASLGTPEPFSVATMGRSATPWVWFVAIGGSVVETWSSGALSLLFHPAQRAGIMS